MDRVLAPRRLPVEERKFTRARVDAKRADLAGVAMHCVEAALLAIEGEEGGVEQVSNRLHMGPCSGLAVKPINVDAVAARIALARRAAPDIGQMRSSHGPFLSRVCSSAQASRAATAAPGHPGRGGASGGQKLPA